VLGPDVLGVSNMGFLRLKTVSGHALQSLVNSYVIRPLSGTSHRKLESMPSSECHTFPSSIDMEYRRLRVSSPLVKTFLIFTSAKIAKSLNHYRHSRHNRCG
jgi:hypothetical protein